MAEIKANDVVRGFETMKPGRYKVTRSFHAGDMAWMHSLMCNNPVYGERQLDEWQDAVIKRLEAKAKPQKRAA